MIRVLVDQSIGLISPIGLIRVLVDNNSTSMIRVLDDKSIGL